jgi:hypothetical protein
VPKGTTPSGRKYEFDAGLAARQLEQRGGFSMQRTSGKTPGRGYMVSDFGSEKIIPGHASAAEIETYRQARPGRLSRGRRYIGGWHDEGKTYLDQSRNVRSPKKAQALGQAGAQRAVYSIDRDKSYRVHHGGRVDVRGTLFEGHAEAAQSLRVGNSDAMRQQKELSLHLGNAVSQVHRHDTGHPAKLAPHVQQRMF